MWPAHEDVKEEVKQEPDRLSEKAISVKSRKSNLSSSLAKSAMAGITESILDKMKAIKGEKFFDEQEIKAAFLTLKVWVMAALPDPLGKIWIDTLP